MAPLMHSPQSCPSARMAAGTSPSATMSAITARPRSSSTRQISRSTAGLSGDRLMTQFDVTTWAERSSSGIRSRKPCRNSTLSYPSAAATLGCDSRATPSI
jgi:hypothetical protein